MKDLKTIVIILFTGLLFVGCGGESAEPTEVVVELTGGPEATETAELIETPTVELTETVAATATAAVTETAEAIETAQATETVPSTPTEEIAMEPLGPVTVETLVEELDSATGGLTVDQDGNIYMADIGAVPDRLGETVYKITPEGEVSVFASGGGMLGASGNAFDSLGNLYQSNFTDSSISKITPEGAVSEFTSLGLWGPVGIVIDEADTLFVANCIGNSVQMVTPEGRTSEFAISSLFDCPNGITMDEEHNLYVVNFRDGRVLKVTPEGKVSVLVTLPGGNNGHIIYAGDGIMYAVSRGAHQIFRVSTSGLFDLVAGSGEAGMMDGVGEGAEFLLPNGIGLSLDGTILYVNHVHVSAGVGDNHPVAIRMIHLGG